MVFSIFRQTIFNNIICSTFRKQYTKKKSRPNNTKNIPGSTAFTVCSDGTYVSEGKCVKCQGVCNNHAPCNKSTGTCDNGCSNHWSGTFCEGIFFYCEPDHLLYSWY